MTNQQDIRELLENLGSKVSILAEENRVCNNRDDAGKNLIDLIGNYLSKDDWLDLYESTDDPYVKELMVDWGSHLFPDKYKL